MRLNKLGLPVLLKGLFWIAMASLVRWNDDRIVGVSVFWKVNIIPYGPLHSHCLRPPAGQEDLENRSD